MAAGARLPRVEKVIRRLAVLARTERKLRGRTAAVTAKGFTANMFPAGPTPEVFVRRASPQPTAVFDSYWKFAAERQAIFHARAQGKRGPWTNDPVLEEYKFTNAYRAADRVSQFLIRNVIYSGIQDWPS